MAEHSSGKLKAFDTRNLVCIEYPGYIKNVDNMLQTLGGEEKISDTYFNTKRRIELHFRPNDPYCHSVCGDMHSARAVLLKVKRKRRKKKGSNSVENEWIYEQEVAGIVNSTYRFTSLVDYQYLAPKELQNAFSHVSTSSLMEEKQPLHIIPPIFSRIDAQGSYNYQPETAKRAGSRNNPLHVVNPVEEDWKKEPISRIRKKRPSEALAAVFTSTEVPKEPGAKSREVLEGMRKRFTWIDVEMETLNKLFEERPLWSRSALYAHLNSKFKRERLKQFLSNVAFYWLNGPWRALWNRFGYDPRKHPEAKIYQICDFRVKDRHKKGNPKTFPVLPLRSLKLRTLPFQLQRNKKNTVTIDQEDEAAKEEEEETSDRPKDLSYTFHASRLPTARQVMYQLCDIYDDDVKRIVAENDGKEKTCTEKDGWLAPGVIVRIRAVMVQKIDVLVKEEMEKQNQAKSDDANQETGDGVDEGETEGFEQDLIDDAGIESDFDDDGDADGDEDDDMGDGDGDD